MTPELSPSAGLRRAAAAELDRLDRARQRLQDKRRTLASEIAAIETEIDALKERDELLRSLVTEEGDHATAASGDDDAIGGAELREVAATILFERNGPGTALHYRDWFEAVLAAGHTVAGKDPLGSFLTNAGRSPLVRRGDEPGTYYIEPEALTDLHAQLAENQAELQDLATQIAHLVTPTSVMSEHRSQLMSEIRRLERLIAEAERVLAPSPQSGQSAAEVNQRAA